MSRDLRRSVDLMLKAADGAGYQARPRDKENDVHGDPSALYSHGELARQLRQCMREIVELRTELAAERDGRGQMMALHAKRVKEELLVEFRAAQHTSQRDFRELEAVVKQRLSEHEQASIGDRRKIEEALRFIRTVERSQFESKEDFRETMDELRGRVDAAVALCTGARAEASQELERERASLQHRLDIELMRYSELYRKQQADVEETKRCMAREVEKVSNTVQQLVDTAWAERMRSMTKEVRDSLAAYADDNDRMAKDVASAVHELEGLKKSTQREIASLTATVGERLGTVESALPVTVSRVERFEHRVEAAVDSNAKLSAAVDVLREGVDKASAHATRAQERVQRLEDTTSDRDERITGVEAQCVQFAGIEKYRLDLEALKRGVARVEHSIDAAIKASERSERISSEALERGDAAVDRVKTTEKQMANLDTKVDMSDKRVGTFMERITVLEDQAAQTTNNVSALDHHREQLGAKTSALDARLSSFSDRSDATLREMREKLSDVETRVDSVADEGARAAESAGSAAKETTRVAKRLSKLETTQYNLTENTQANKAATDQLQRQLDALAARSDGLDRQLAACQSISTRADDGSQELQRQLGAMSDRLGNVSTQAAAASRDAARALRERPAGTADAASASLTTADVEASLRESLGRTEDKVLRTVDAKVTPLRERLMELEDRVQDVRARSAAAETDHADIQRLRGDVARHSSDVSLLQQQVVDLQSRPSAVVAQKSGPPSQRTSMVAEASVEEFALDDAPAVPEHDARSPPHAAKPEAQSQPQAQSAGLSPTWRSNFTLGSDDRAASSAERDASTDSSTPQRSSAEPVRRDTPGMTPGGSLAQPAESERPSSALPPLAPGSAQRPVPATPHGQVTAAANPYQSDDSSGTGSLAVPRRRDLSVDDSTTGDTTDALSPSPERRAVAASGFSTSSSESRDAGASLARAHPQSANPFTDTPPPKSEPAEGGAAARGYDDWDDEADADGDDSPASRDAKPEAADGRPQATATAAWAESGLDDVVSAPSSRPPPKDASEHSPAQTQATSDVALTGVSTLPGGSGDVLAGDAAPAAQPAAPRSSAWNFDEDEDADEDDEESVLDDDDLANMM